MSIAPSVETIAASDAPRAASWRRRVLGAPGWLIGRLFGLIAVVVGLAIAATVPGLQPLTLGYLLEVSARVGRSGRLRDGLIGLPEACRLGSIVVAITVCFLPAWFLSSLARDASVIDPNGKTAQGAMFGFRLILLLTFWHVLGSLLRGGRLRNFLLPRFIDTGRRLSRPGTFTAARDAVWETFAAMRPTYFYGLGLRVALATFVWLVVPVTLMYVGGRRPVIALIGGALTAIVMAWLPWLQTQAAVDYPTTSRGATWRRMFAVGDVRRRFRRAPWTSAAAITLLLVLALPLNLLKIEMIPREAAWLPGIVFVLFAIPARLALGKVYAWGERRTAPRRFYNVWPARLVVIGVTLAFVFVTYLSQTTAWYGRMSLYEQHAVLFPVPFLASR